MYTGRNVRNIVVWGNNSDTMVADLSHAKVIDSASVYGGQESTPGPSLFFPPCAEAVACAPVPSPFFLYY